MQAKKIDLRTLLARGDMSKIGEKLGVTRQAVSLALKEGKPSHPAVKEALRIARESGALAAAQDLATLSPAA